LKYWLLTTEYPPLFGGGISTYCYHTANMLAEKGYAVTVFIPDEQVKNYKEEKKNSIRIIKFGTNRTGMQNYLGHVPNMAYAFAGITRHFIEKEGSPDCIESQEYLAISYYILQFKLLKYPGFENVAILLTLHSPAFLYLHYNREGIYSFPNYWIGEMEKSCIQCADYIIAPSQYIIDEIKKHISFDESKVSVIHNPYSFQQNENATQKNISRNKMIFFGKLSPQKGVFEMFAYLKNLWDNGFENILTVIGGTDKVYYPEMKTMGQIINDKYEGYIKKGLIKFEGKIAPEKKSASLSDAHVVIIPSLNDNLPYAAIEAMSAGKVVLTSVQGGQKEITEDGVDGFLFDHEKPETFAEKLKHILSLNDNDLKKTGNAAAKKISLLLNYENIFAQKNALIHAVILQNGARDKFPFVHAAYPFIENKNDNDSKDLLSVVIPYFNMGDYIADCIHSIISSSYQDIEIIIINDGSTDQRSIDLLKQFEQNLKIKIIHKKNEGLADTRNYGAQIANGEYLSFLDADDKVHTHYYAKAINVLKQYQNIFFVGSWVKYFGTKKDVWPTWNPEPPYILLHNSVNSSSLVYKKTAFLQAGLFDKKVDYGIEDYESVINMLHHGYCGVVLPECLFFYRVRKDSMYRSLTHYKTLYSYQYIAEKHADFYSKFAPQIFNLLNANGPSFIYDNPSFEIKVSSRNMHPHNSMNKIKNIVKKNPALKKVILKIANVLKLK
jgi:glycosyltransferase involved in cell wall biosynthesis